MKKTGAKVSLLHRFWVYYRQGGRLKCRVRVKVPPFPPVL